ncbi:DUF4190 domain-containing protein [Pyxidicoccus fallax]|uniref:DUF4190 domain-containing protein n=1 Tax=Pyxidicoccus fallax TaxID=394095 RepID=A0A848LVA8_9BACT|nr:DUF4190 domain-containing protein [Pyxidicoccus fallax]NMO21726.1 DUF4190 domain-containing protein [Pyxidicoccus fallax]NPC86010.1 DUF4190 domain-containing protein [Pyxidicoccus fallax]
MNAQPLSATPVTEGAVCNTHPDRAALGTCARCGTFYCSEDRELVHGKIYCGTCAVLPEVDYLEAFRLKYWGKRDAWAWLVGLGAVANILLGGITVAVGAAESLLFGLFLLAAGVVGACFWLGMPWARLGFLFVPVGSIIVGAATEGAVAIARGVLPLAIAICIYNDTRNKLFFKEPVPAETLQKAWDLYMNNTMARAGFYLGILGVLVPGVGVIAIICSVIGLRRVNPNAHPPIGRKGQAITGIILGCISLVGWVAMMTAFSRAMGD